MSTRITAYISPNDEIYIKQANVLKACIAAGLKELPPETAKYFGDSYPHIDKLHEKLEI